ncbi:MAG: hypothetical protein ACK5LX_16685 [Oscillospiraceae bacterium]
MSLWIWKFGEMETYHNLLVHNRRVQYGHPEPPVWKLYSPDSVVRSRRTVTTGGGVFHIKACGSFAVTVGSRYPNIKKYGGRDTITLEPGTTEITVTVSNPDAFPCLYIDGVITTGEGWMADDLNGPAAPVGWSCGFDSPEHIPTVFPFCYEPIAYTSKEETAGGVLFDFGRETFAKTEFSVDSDAPVTICFGESREEALDAEWSVIHTTVQPKNGKIAFDAQAFRYIHVSDSSADVAARYEYLPLERRGAFLCGEELVNRVWDVAAYTFHLNCREFFLDGIKRDRWVWSADAYQCLFVNRYLFFDAEIEKRTLIALGGKQPFRSHINTIMDYTFFWVISLWEYYTTYGDRAFLEQISPQLEEVMAFCRGRVDGDGFMRGKPEDWVFIDWAPMDKEGALCGEQVLLAEALRCYSLICGVTGRDEKGCGEQSEALRAAILEQFYDPEKKVFIDSFESGKRNVTRHSNILAYLFLPLDEDVKVDIYERVLLNDDVRQITTPYFKFYENQVHCLAGNGDLLERSIREYYGAMLATGATTLYEEFDPTQSGAEHYAMYGHPYEKSLCHAWSASPIYLLGRFRAGVRNTGIAYDSFEVRPAPGDLGVFRARVPLPEGHVDVEMEETKLTVLATAPGGTLHWKGAGIELGPGEPVTVDR